MHVNKGTMQRFLFHQHYRDNNSSFSVRASKFSLGIMASCWRRKGQNREEITLLNFGFDHRKEEWREGKVVKMGWIHDLISFWRLILWEVKVSYSIFDLSWFGLSSLVSRYQLLSAQKMAVLESAETFIVRIPIVWLGIRFRVRFFRERRIWYWFDRFDLIF